METLKERKVYQMRSELLEYYDIESLIKLNTSYNHVHKVTRYDLNKVNRLIDVIYKNNNGIIVRAGDRVKAIGYNSYNECERIHNYALVERIDCFEEREVYMCMNAYVPFTDEVRGGVSCSASGGYWHGEKDFSRFKHLGYVLGAFTTWGHCGCTGNGAVDFFAPVCYWEYVNKEDIY